MHVAWASTAGSENIFAGCLKLCTSWLCTGWLCSHIVLLSFSRPALVQDTLGNLLAASGDPSVQGMARDLPQKILESKVESDSVGQLHHLAKWKQWADTNPGVDVFPVEPSKLWQYLTHLVDSDGHEAAITDVSKAMTWVHSLAGYMSPITDHQVDTLLTQLQGES